MPDKFEEPKMKDGRSFEEGVANLFQLSIPINNDKTTFSVYINNLIIDKKGKCVDFIGKVYDQRQSNLFLDESVNIEMTEVLNKWVKEQTFQTKHIPKGFERYSFLCIVRLK